MGMTIHCSSACQNRGFTYIARRAIKVRVICPVTLTFCRIHNARFTGMYYDVVAESPNVSVRFESNHKTVYRWRFFRQSIRYMIRTVQGIFFFYVGVLRILSYICISSVYRFLSNDPRPKKNWSPCSYRNIHCKRCIKRNRLLLLLYVSTESSASEHSSSSTRYIICVKRFFFVFFNVVAVPARQCLLWYCFE